MNRRERAMNSYEINKNTNAIVSINEDITKIIEAEEEYFVNKSCYEVMEESCQYYGSSCDGRIKGTKNILGSTYKVPIIIEETNDIIFFPTEAIYKPNCIWFALNHIKSYENAAGYTKVIFDSGKELIVKMSITSFENQVLRANRLSSVLKQRREKE